MANLKRYNFYYQNDVGDEYPAYEKEDVDGEYVKFEDSNTERVVICSDNLCEYCTKNIGLNQCGVCDFQGQKLTPVS